MAGRVPHTELNAVRALVSGSLAEIDAAGGTGQVWMRSACARLSAVDGLLTECAGVLAAPVRVLAVSVVTFLAVLAAASPAAAAGASTAGLLLISGGAVAVTLGPALLLTRRMMAALGRRRLARLPVPRPPVTPPPPVRPVGTRDFLDQAGTKGRLIGSESGSPAGEGVLAGVPERLLHARVRLVSLAMRQAGTADWTTPLIRRAIRTDPVIRRLAHADQLLCQAVDCLERHLGEDRR